MSSIAIKAENLGKAYQLRQAAAGTLREELPAMLRRFGRASKETFWALKDVSFEIPEGQVTGIIGANGAGKSTLLKIISRITPPSEGRIVLDGRVASLLEVGTGFHPELSGRENIYLNGAILGMSRTEIRRKFDEIVAFSGVERFLDTPVKHYSSGMYVRLAFAVAAHLEAEILLIDEVLAVGDAAFQQKCLGKMGELANSGRTVVVVSHNMAQISRLCPKCMLLQQGKILAYAHTSSILEDYERLSKDKKSEGFFKQDKSESIAISAVEIRNSNNQVDGCLKYGEPFSIKMTIRSPFPLEKFALTVEASRHTGEWVFSAISSQSQPLFSIEADKTLSVLAHFDKLTIRPGSYTLHLSIAENIASRYSNLVLPDFLKIEEIPYLNTPAYEGYWGGVRLYPNWETVRD